MIAAKDALSPINEETYLRLLTICDFADGHVLLFARCNAPTLRNQLSERLRADLVERGYTVYEIDVTEQTPMLNLTERIRETLSTPPQSEQAIAQKSILFLTGLENSLPFDDPNAALLAELNMGRELLLREVPLPIVFWLPDYAITSIARYALDFWSWRSGVFEFETEAEHHEISHAQIVRQNSDWLSISNLNAEQKQRRLRVLEGLLADYEAAEKDGDAEATLVRATQTARGELFEQLAQLHYSLDEVEKAISYLEYALVVAREIDDKEGEGNILGNLGNAHLSLGEVEKAIRLHEQALAAARENGDKQSEGTHLGNLGNTYYSLGEMEKAISHLEYALTISRQIGDKHGGGNWLGCLGNAYAAWGEVEQAGGYYEQALTISREIGDRLGEGNALSGLGGVYANLGELEKASGYHEQALAISREIGDKRGEGNTLGNLGNVHWKLGEVTKTIHYYEAGLAISREIGNKQGEGNTLGNLGNVYADLGEVEKTRDLWQQSFAIFEAINSPNAQTVRRWLAELE